MKKLLVIKNKRSKSKKIKAGFSKESHFDVTLHNEDDGLDIVFTKKWDIIILDWDDLTLPGPEICKKIRERQSTPIIIITDNISTESCIAGLHAGADDYIRKPFDVEELIARINVIFRIRETANSYSKSQYTFKNLSIDDDKKTVTKDGNTIKLTKREYDLLIFLVKNKNKVLSRELLLNELWGYNNEVHSNVVDLYIGYLRKKINDEESGNYISTLYGRGYSMGE